jgi:putative transposase
MRFCNSIFVSLLKPLDRRALRAIVERHGGDAYDKGFRSWDHLLALIFAQLSGLNSLRGVVAGWNANPHHHYHLGTARLARTTLADANARRPVAVFAECFEMLSRLADRDTRRAGQNMLRLIDASPIPLGRVCTWAAWNGRIRGLKMHCVYDPASDRPTRVEVTPATVNDIEIGRKTTLEGGATYVFDKGYCHYGWWTEMHARGAFFVTRPKTNARFRTIAARPLAKTVAKTVAETVAETDGDGFRIMADEEVRLASKGNSALPMPLRRIAIERHNGKPLAVLTNDMTRSAVEIALLYKTRWQIELLFRWIKQHLELRRFLGNNDNAIQLQIIAAMIAYLLLRIAARLNALTLSALRLAERVRSALFTRIPLPALHHPPPRQPHYPKHACPNQGELCYA